MAVRAAHDALLDFREQRLDACSGTDQIAYRAPLCPADMIEFQNDRIHDPAVNARMLAQIGNDERLVSRAISGHAHASAFIERTDVLSMVSPRIAAPTFAADAVDTATSLVAYSEFTFVLSITA